ncbi:NF-kappa-B inhibitor-interacting Ras-like protein 2 [Actinia tenebrosa]|uniref:NF-kappa-B inhibitor-interacting Ras-like protein 2 n=1 Tax=Actinia tenebrosa TaxID=6105 RepID=A0A6P8ILH6_ACTTE|nr:NF-kappa-B inhibitor-interacting Ras-like protein 2 [Actinia tenebrosa]
MPKILRLVVIGAKSVGKTALIEQAVFGNHVPGRPTYRTIEDVYEVLLEIEKGVKEKFRIYDTGGMEDIKGELSKNFLNTADGFLLVYSTTSKRSFQLVQNLKKEIDKGRGKDFPIFVIGTKTDMIEERESDPKDTSHWADSEKVRLTEVCVGDRKSLQDPFTWIAKKMVTCAGKGYLPSSDVKKFLSIRKSSKGLYSLKDSNLDLT